MSHTATQNVHYSENVSNFTGVTHEVFLISVRILRNRPHQQETLLIQQRWVNEGRQANQTTTNQQHISVQRTQTGDVTGLTLFTDGASNACSE